jgi:uncharacterized protein YggE
LQVKLEGTLPDTLATDAAQVVDTAMASGANTAGGIHFYLSHNHAAPKEALRLAIRQAKELADVAAQAAGVELGNMVRMETHTQPMALRQEIMAMPLSARGVEDVPTPIEAGLFDVSSTVTVSFRILP